MKCTFSLLTSRLQCLRRLYSLKPWVCVSVLLSDYWPSIRRRIKPLCLLCFFCLLTFWPVSAVRAQEPTPTNTLEPFYTAPTPGPDVNYSCPDGIPEGWGQYEPDPSWLFHCSQCLPPGDGYEWGDPPDGWDDLPEGWPTQQPATLTPTPGPVVLDYQVTNILTLDPFEPEVWNQYVQYHHRFQNWFPTIFDKVNSSSGEWIIYISYYAIGSYPTPGYPYSGTFNFRFGTNHNDPVTVEVLEGSYITTDRGYNQSFEGSVYSWSDPGTETITFYSGNGTQTVEFEIYMNFKVTIDGSNGTWDEFSLGYKHTGFYQGAHATDYVGLVYENVYYSPVSLPQPEPEGSYCDTVLPLGSGDDDDDNFSLPGFWFGDMQCFTLGGFDIPLEWLNIFFEGAQIVDWTMPGMQFCFQSIHFDNLTLFGLEINLDWIALAMGGVVLFRFLTRS